MTRRRKLAFALVTVTVGLAAVLLFAEFAVRWSLMGAPRPALLSFFRSPEVFVSDPDLGFKLNPDRKGASSLGIMHGEIASLKPAGLFRVVVLGDSVSFDHFGFVPMLQEGLQRLRRGPVEVINASIPGFTTYQELVLLRRDLIGFEPDLVILQYCLNDNHTYLHFLDETGRWLLTPDAERAAGFDRGGWLASLTRSSYLLLTIRIGLAHFDALAGTPFAWERRPDFYAAWEDSSWPPIEACLREMKSLSESAGGKFLVVAVPFKPQFSTQALERDREYTLKPQRRLNEICSRLGVPILDMFPVFSKQPVEEIYRDQIHLTEHGHRIVAEELLALLRREL
jgi:lysophospholipase L1-like esterase